MRLVFQTGAAGVRAARITICLPLLAAAAVAQSTYGSIAGILTDPTKAIVRDATVQVTNANTGASRSVKTDAEGFFRFVNLDPGTYRISAEAQGFAKSDRSVSLLARDEM